MINITTNENQADTAFELLRTGMERSVNTDQSSSIEIDKGISYNFLALIQLGSANY